MTRRVSPGLFRNLSPEKLSLDSVFSEWMIKYDDSIISGDVYQLDRYCVSHSSERIHSKLLQEISEKLPVRSEQSIESGGVI